MRKIWSMIIKDFTIATRDRLMVFVIFYAVIFAFVIRIFVPTVESTQVKFAVYEGVGEQVISQIEDFGEVDLFDSVESVYDRVERIDSIAGVVMEGETIQLVFEGNEPEGLIDTYKMILAEITSPEIPIPIDYRATEEKGSLLIDLLTVILVVMAIYVGALSAGLNIVNEKETKAICAIAISPLNFGKYIISKYATSLFIGLFGTLCASLILVGLTIDYVKLLLVVVFSGAMVIATSMFVGAFAENQMSALILEKVTGWLYMIVPILTFFVSEKWQVIFYPLPTYWQVMMIKNVFLTEVQKFDFWFSGIMTFATGFVMLLILGNIFRKKVRI